jgi:two-component sensor histidine kinase
MKKQLCIFLFFLLPLISFGQENLFKSILKKEEQIVNKPSSDSLVYEYLWLYHNFYYLDSLKANAYLKKYYDLAKSESDLDKMGLFNYFLSIQYLYQKKFKEAYDNATLSQEYFNGIDDFLFLESQQVRMKSLLFLKEYRKAEKIGKKIIANSLYESLPLQLAKIYYNLGLAAQQLQSDASILYFQNATRLLENEHNNGVKLHVYHYLSEEYSNKNQWDSALYYAEKAYLISKDTLNYNQLDYLIPAFRYQKLLRELGKITLADSVYSEIQLKKHQARVASIKNPYLHKRVAYLEYLRSKQEIRYVILLSLIFSIVILFLIIFYFNRKLKSNQHRLEESLSLNKLYLYETHHRVKNNFQNMLTMLDVNTSSSAYTVEEFVTQARAKIAIMSILQDLFLQINQSTIKAEFFIGEVVKTLQYYLNFKKEYLLIDKAALKFPIQKDKMIPLGLMISELLIHSAHKKNWNENNTKLKILLQKENEFCLLIFINENMPISKNYKSTLSSELKVLNTLSEQINGEIDIYTDNIFQVNIKFKG